MLTQCLTQDNIPLTHQDIQNTIIKKYLDLNIKNPGQPIFQSYSNFKYRKTDNGQHTTSIFNPYNANVWELFDGELHSIFTSVADDILTFIKEKSDYNYLTYDEYIKNINVFALELENVWDRIFVDQNFMTNRKNLYIAGDCAGISQGILQAMVSGISVAEGIKNNI